MQSEVDEKESSMELAHAIEEQRQQLDELNKVKDEAKKRLESCRRDIEFLFLCNHELIDLLKRISKRQKKIILNW